jgi:hypothetical protein
MHLRIARIHSTSKHCRSDSPASKCLSLLAVIEFQVPQRRQSGDAFSPPDNGASNLRSDSPLKCSGTRQHEHERRGAREPRKCISKFVIIRKEMYRAGGRDTSIILAAISVNKNFSYRRHRRERERSTFRSNMAVKWQVANKIAYKMRQYFIAPPPSEESVSPLRKLLFDGLGTFLRLLMYVIYFYFYNLTKYFEIRGERCHCLGCRLRSTLTFRVGGFSRLGGG